MSLQYRLETAKRNAGDNWREYARARAKERFNRSSPWGPISNGRRFLESVKDSGLFVIDDNATESVTRNRTQGYYVDNYANESVHGVVFATRVEDSPKARFFAAVNDPYNDSAYLVVWRAFDDLSDARAYADSFAESYAEESREYDSAWHAGARYSELADDIRAMRREALAILRDRKSARGSATLCAVIREKLESLLSDIREAREARERLKSGEGENARDYRNQFWPGDARLRAAFNDGAGAQCL